MNVIDLSKAEIIVDDNEAKELLARDNALSGLVPEPPYDSISCTYRNDRGFVYATRSCVPGDSGFTVVILPEEHYSAIQAAVIIAFLQASDNLFPGTEQTYFAEMTCPNN